MAVECTGVNDEIPVVDTIMIYVSAMTSLQFLDTEASIALFYLFMSVAHCTITLLIGLMPYLATCRRAQSIL